MSDLSKLSVDQLVAGSYCNWDAGLAELARRLRAAEAERDEALANYKRAAKSGQQLALNYDKELKETQSDLAAARAEVARLREAVGDTIARWLTRGDFNLVSGIRAALAAQPEPGAAHDSWQLSIILKIIRHGLTGDTKAVAANASFLADKMQESGDAKSAERLRRYAVGDFGKQVHLLDEPGAAQEGQA